MVYYLVLILILGTIITISGCKKNNKSEISDLTGTWISTDLQDTLDFTSDQDLYKIIYGVPDHYGYSIIGDSIKIEYSGSIMPYIYIPQPYNRFFQRSGNSLSIDFRPPLFGFRSQVLSFKRK